MGIRCFTILRIHKLVPTLFSNLIEFIISLYNFLVTYSSRYKEYMICLISFIKFPDVLPTFTCSRAIGNLWSICLGVSILICLAKFKESPLPRCYLLKSIFFLTIWTTFFEFSFSRISFLLILFLKSIGRLLILFTDFSFLFCLTLSLLIKTMNLSLKII